MSEEILDIRSAYIRDGFYHEEIMVRTPDGKIEMRVNKREWKHAD